MINIDFLVKHLGISDGKAIHTKFNNKRSGARKRGLDFDLHNEDVILLADKLLGNGVCDYTGLPFNNSKTDEYMYPSLERIDDSLGYVRGNVCVVGVRPNQLKDVFYDKTNTYPKGYNLGTKDVEFLRCMNKTMTPEHMENLVKTYTPVIQAINEEEVKMNNNENKEPYASLISKDIVENPTVELNNFELPPDVAIAAGYAEMCKFLHRNKREVTITFAQFKVAYNAKKCIITGKELGDNRIPFLMDNEAPVEAGNVKFVDNVAGSQMNNLLSATGLTFEELAKNLKKFA